MAHTADAIPAIDQDIDNNNDVRDEDPGAYLIPFGEHTGERLDVVPPNLRWWATDAKRAHNSWYATFVEANKRYEELLLNTPESYPFPFGEYEGKRLDEVEESLIRWATNPSRSNAPWYKSLAEASRRYFDKVARTKPPGSVKIVRKTHGEHRPDDYVRFKDLDQRDELYRDAPPREYRRRRPPNVQNPTGELLGQEDDGRGSVEPDDDYQRDGFIVDDDDYEEPQYESEEGSTSESISGGITERSVSQTDQPSLSRASADASQSSASYSNPDDDEPLDELREKITKAYSYKQSKAGFMSPSKHRGSRRSLNEDSDTSAQPVRKRLRRKSDAESHNAHSPLDVSSIHQDDQLSQSVRSLSLSQESVANNPSGSGIKTNKLGRHYRVVVESDDEL